MNLLFGILILTRNVAAVMPPLPKACIDVNTLRITETIPLERGFQIRTKGGTVAINGIIENVSAMPEKVELIKRQQIIRPTGIADMVDFWKECRS